MIAATVGGVAVAVDEVDAREARLRDAPVGGRAPGSRHQ